MGALVTRMSGIAKLSELRLLILLLLDVSASPVLVLLFWYNDDDDDDDGIRVNLDGFGWFDRKALALQDVVVTVQKTAKAILMRSLAVVVDVVEEFILFIHSM